VRKGTRVWLALRLIVLASGISSCGGETERVFLHVSSAEERQVRVYADPDDPAEDVYEWRLLSPTCSPRSRSPRMVAFRPSARHARYLALG